MGETRAEFGSGRVQVRTRVRAWVLEEVGAIVGVDEFARMHVRVGIKTGGRWRVRVKVG